MSKIPKAETKKAMPFIMGMKKRLEEGVSKDEVFERRLAFDEEKVIHEMIPALKATVLHLKEIKVVKVENASAPGHPNAEPVSSCILLRFGCE